MTIPELLSGAMQARKLSERSLANFLKLAPSTVYRYRKGMGVPDPAQCRQIADRLGIPEEDVLRAAGHLSPPHEPTPLPSWLQALIPTLSKLDDFEARTVEATAQTLLELRELRGGYVASPPPAPTPPLSE